MSTWSKCSNAFLKKFLPIGRTNALRTRIFNFQQTEEESIPEAWEKLQGYIQACPHHGIEDCLILQNFYTGLTPISKGHADAAAGGAFLSLTTDRATALIERMVAKNWGEDRTLVPKGIHPVKETEVLALKDEQLLQKLDERAAIINHGTVRPTTSQMTCDVCGTIGHSGHHCHETHEKASYINNRNRQPGGNNGWNIQSQGNSNSHFHSNSNQPSLRDLIYSQTETTENLHRQMLHNELTLQHFYSKIEYISSFIRNQLSFNFMIETKLAAAVPVNNTGVIPGQPEISPEFVHTAAEEEKSCR